MVRLGVLLVVLVGALAASASADTPTQLYGTAGPDFTISLVDAHGSPVTHLDPGTYGINVEDLSEFHNFHLTGPGVDKTTSLTELESAYWEVTLTDGTYTFVCDVHPTMRGSFTVGTPPPVVHAFSGRVGPGAAIGFTRSASAGKAKLTIHDATAKDNFHLTGPGVNRKTGVAFKGTVTWTITLKPGTYTFRSDAHPKLKGTTKVK
jgi:plastocyanin